MEEAKKRFVVIDADSIVYRAAHKFTDKDAPLSSLDFFDLEFKLNLMYEWIEDFISNDIVLALDADLFLVCLGGEGNFRKEIYPTYKEGRPPRPELYEYARDYIENNFPCFITHGAEAEDTCYSYWLEYKDVCEVIIAGIDKDLNQFPATFYNYNYRKLITLDDYTAYYNLICFLIQGDSADNLKFCKGDGEVWCEKNLLGLDKISMLKTVIQRYKHHYKSKYMEKLKLHLKLVKLTRVKIKQLN